MKNALKYGLIIGVLSALWIAIMHLSGYNPGNLADSPNQWLEYTSILIPFIGLNLGIRGFKKENGGQLNFFEGIIEGFKIIAIGGLLAVACSFLYLSLFTQAETADYMERIFGAIVLGILFSLVNSLLLMNNPKNL